MLIFLTASLFSQALAPTPSSKFGPPAPTPLEPRLQMSFLSWASAPTPPLEPQLQCPSSNAPAPMPQLQCPNSSPNAPAPMPQLQCPSSSPNAPAPMPQLQPQCPSSNAPAPMPQLQCPSSNVLPLSSPSSNAPAPMSFLSRAPALTAQNPCSFSPFSSFLYSFANWIFITPIPFRYTTERYIINVIVTC